MDPSNSLDWCYAILSLTFVIPVMLNVEGSLHWQAGAMAVLNSWVGLLLYLQRCCPILIFSFSSVCNPLSCIFFFPFRFEGVGIYVVMLWEILRTLFRVVMLFGFLMIAFSLAFYALLLNQVGTPGRVLGWLCHVCCVHKSCPLHSERVSNRATLSDADICDDGRGTELSKQHPGLLPEGWAAFHRPDLHGFSELHCGHANSAGEFDGECLPDGSVFTVHPISLLTFVCSLDWFSSWGHRWSPKKCLPEENSHAGLSSNSCWLCCKWSDNCKAQTSISGFRLNSTLLLKKGCRTGLSNRWTKAPSLSTPTASALRCVLLLKFQVYSR